MFHFPSLDLWNAAFPWAPLVSATFYTENQNGMGSGKWLAETPTGRGKKHLVLKCVQGSQIELSEQSGCFAWTAEFPLSTQFSSLWILFFKSFPPDPTLGICFFKAFRKLQPKAVWPLGHRTEDSCRVRLWVFFSKIWSMHSQCFPRTRRHLGKCITSPKLLVSQGLFPGRKGQNPANP